MNFESPYERYEIFAKELLRRINIKSVAVDFDSRQKGRPITADDITNLKIALNTAKDVNQFLASI